MHHGRTVIAGALTDLDAIIERARQGGSTQRFMADLERWHVRVANSIEDSISEEEARRFARISIRPSWVHDEPIDAPLERLRGFLEALSDDLAREPEPAAPVKRPVKSAQPKVVQPSDGFYDLRTQADKRSLNASLEREAKVRGLVWKVMAAFAALVLAALALYNS